ncbi:MAG: serine protease [Chitinophagaceae bacterium]|nr:MAG: serine protease [Chitinophagaceae bacterium]
MILNNQSDKYKIQYFHIFLSFIIILSACKKSSKTYVDIQFSIHPNFVTVAIGKTFPQKLSIKISSNVDGTLPIEWVSENSSIATVSSDGVLKGIKPGEVMIKASIRGGGGTATCKVVVYDTLDYKYRLVLKDKGPVSYSFNHPQAYLSNRAIEQRIKNNIAIDSSDIPISEDYLNQIQNLGGIIVSKSKWLKTVSVHISNPSNMDKIRNLPFVKDVQLVWMDIKDTTAYFKTLVTYKTVSTTRNVFTPAYYGNAWNNIKINNGQYLHDNGFKGQGMEIAVLDAGFYNWNAISTLTNVDIKGTKSFIYQKPNVFQLDTHGTTVTSCMATNLPGTFVGTAPDASYWLLATEDNTTEFPIEEDYWVQALEYVDSIGIKIVNTSLGYRDYDPLIPPASYTYVDMNGRSSHASKGANIAAAKGILIICSAGNESSFVGTPADSPNVLAIGAVDPNNNISTFSSYGITVDGRVKPDVLALGTSSAVISTNGTVRLSNGTSYASPILCGLAACLWQANPKLNNFEIMQVIKQSANRYQTPIMPFGYGIADMQIAMQLAQNLSATK